MFLNLGHIVGCTVYLKKGFGIDPVSTSASANSLDITTMVALGELWLSKFSPIKVFLSSSQATVFTLKMFDNITKRTSIVFGQKYCLGRNLLLKPHDMGLVAGRQQWRQFERGAWSLLRRTARNFISKVMLQHLADFNRVDESTKTTNPLLLDFGRRLGRRIHFF